MSGEAEARRVGQKLKRAAVQKKSSGPRGPFLPRIISFMDRRQRFNIRSFSLDGTKLADIFWGEADIVSCRNNDFFERLQKRKVISASK